MATILPTARLRRPGSRDVVPVAVANKIIRSIIICIPYFLLFLFTLTSLNHLLYRSLLLLRHQIHVDGISTCRPLLNNLIIDKLPW